MLWSSLGPTIFFPGHPMCSFGAMTASSTSIPHLYIQGSLVLETNMQSRCCMEGVAGAAREWSECRSPPTLREEREAHRSRLSPRE